MTTTTTWARAAALATLAATLLHPVAASAAKEPPPPFQPCRAFQKPWLPNAHSHNDYENRRPLCDALYNGHTSVEADIWYVKNIAGEESLQVGHTSPIAGRLDQLYLEKLRDVIAYNQKTYGKKAVLPGYSGRFQLLVDIKSTGPEARRAFELLHQTLRDHYRTMVTRWHDGRKFSGQVDVVVTGNRPANPVIDGRRFVGIDGEASELNGPHRMGRCKRVPLVSGAWTDAYDDPAVLRRLVGTANARGQYFRVYHADRSTWQKLYDAGVHYIDSGLHPAALRAFLKDKGRVTPPSPCIP
ncbi:hypothetical protein AB0G05_04545 [Nonomuraea wenchangensis]